MAADGAHEEDPVCLAAALVTVQQAACILLGVCYLPLLSAALLLSHSVRSPAVG
jgi:hypothetical protein